MLERTLRSLAAQEGAPRFKVLVVENDGQGREGEAVALRLLAEGAIEGAAIVEARQGNCKAYNAAWSFVRREWPDIPFICGIDDDEEATPGWLAALVAAAERSGADIVGGTVIPVFSDARFEPLRAHPIFSSHYGVDGPVPQLYSSANYLIQAEAIDRMGYPYLDERFDYTGGGDSDFFSRARARGFRFWWASAAAMTETIPARRTEWSWINARALRNGMLSALIERKAIRPAWPGEGGGQVAGVACGLAPARLARPCPHGLATGGDLPRAGGAGPDRGGVRAQHRAVPGAGEELRGRVGLCRFVSLSPHPEPVEG